MGDIYRKLNDMKKVVDLDGKMLSEIINKAIMKRLNEGFDTNNFFDDLNNMVDNPIQYFKGNENDENSEELECCEEVAQFINELEQKYSDDIIIKAFEEELEGLRKTAEYNT